MFNPPSPRQAGVLTQRPDQNITGNPKTLVHFAPAEMVAVQYIDENGTARATVVLKVGNAWYMPPNSEQWSSNLRPLAGWLEKQCEAQVSARQTAEVPTSDGVNLFAGGDKQ